MEVKCDVKCSVDGCGEVTLELAMGSKPGHPLISLEDPSAWHYEIPLSDIKPDIENLKCRTGEFDNV